MGISLLMISIYRSSLGGEYLPQLPKTSTNLPTAARIILIAARTRTENRPVAACEKQI
jgi:hypothetical protein